MLHQSSGPGVFVLVLVELRIVGILLHIMYEDFIHEYPTPPRAKPLEHVLVKRRNIFKQRYPREDGVEPEEPLPPGQRLEPLAIRRPQPLWLLFLLFLSLSSSLLGSGIDVVIGELLALDVCFSSVVFFAGQEASIQVHLRRGCIVHSVQYYGFKEVQYSAAVQLYLQINK